MTASLEQKFPSTVVHLKDFSGASYAQFLVGEFQKNPHCSILIVNHAEEAILLKDQIRFFKSDASVFVMPSWDVKPYYGLSPHKSVLRRHLRALQRLMSGQVDFLIVPFRELIRFTIPHKIFFGASQVLHKQDLMDREELIQKLVSLGYERYSLVEDEGQFAVRGDVVDVFSPAYDKPVRLNFFDIELEEMRFFDPVTQRTAESLNEVHLIPAHQILLSHYCVDRSEQKDRPLDEALRDLIHVGWKSELKRRSDARNLPKEKRDQIEEFVDHRVYFHGIESFVRLFYTQPGTLFEYLPQKTRFYFSLDEHPVSALRSWHQNLQDMQSESQHIETIFSSDDLFLNEDQLSDCLKSHSVFFYEPVDLLLNESSSWKSQDVVTIQGESESNLQRLIKLKAEISHVHSLAPLASELNQKRLDGVRCFIVCQSDLQRERVVDLLSRFDMPLSQVTAEIQKDVVQSSLQLKESDRLVKVMTGLLHQGFYSTKRAQWWITDEEIFGKKTKRAAKGTRHKSAVFSSFSELTDGDFIIHMDHGIGIYRGLVKLEYDVHQNDFLLVEYLGGDKLYVPVDKLNRVQRYVGEEGATPLLDKLGGKTWLKTRVKAKKAARKLAKELLEMQAKRSQLKGLMMGEHREAYEEFAASFEFEETPDQLTAIEDVFRDLESTKPMDRLICGDVGYGKTEVAMRAAFKAVQDGHQVAILVPTTVLAFQHFTTFAKRFASYPVKVDLLSRFRSDKEQKDTVLKLKTGQVDIIVGTHRLLSQDIKFKSLGLLVIDEEHRFGVIHKEKIKKLKSLVDVLTLTATPIPRTLNFALNGIRDLSVINTPPVDRLAVKTYTCYFDDMTIRDATLKEVRRGGQVFFLHNRVQSIEKITAQLSKLIPEAKFRYAHGQMEEGQLEDIMIDFMEHKFDVLVCTTIIESGVDIPNANTMFINRADSLGLAQLYQLRGRVGRSTKQGYCYLIIPEESMMTVKAKKRLAAIQKFTELGSGFKIASRDLEIRGAGNILGDEQSGHIAAIGYDLYVHLLNEAIMELKNQNLPEDFEPEISLQMPAKIPDDFISDSQLRLQLYKTVSGAIDFNEVDDIKSEWEDRFGKLPVDVVNLLGLIKIKILAKEILVEQIKQSGSKLHFVFHQQHMIDPQIFIESVQTQPKIFSLNSDGRFTVDKSFADSESLIATVLDLLGQFKEARVV